jgi:hypothetical protein
VDVTIQSGLGWFFAAKLRAGVLYAIYDRTGDPTALQEALKTYRTARAIWAKVAAETQGVYVRDITFGLENQLRGHWQDRLAAIDQDIADMEKRVQSPPAQEQANAPAPAQVAQAIQTVLGRVQRPLIPLVHMVPPLFVAGQPVTVELALLGQPSSPVAVRLCYRRVHQAQPYQSADMLMQDRRYSATIPGEYTNTAYPLEYYFELRDEAGQAWMFPGFDATLTNQPYFIVRQA